MIRFGRDVCASLDEALTREWLETNGIGGFASSTIIGLNTRRYHGLLVAATKPPVGRLVLLSKLEETLIVGADRFELSANRYPGVVYPQGYRFLSEFRLDPFPTFTYEVGGGLALEKTVFMVHGQNTTVVRYELKTGRRDCRLQVPNDRLRPLRLELRPLMAFRDYHGLTHENVALNRHVDTEAGSLRIQPYPNLPTLHIRYDAGEVTLSGDWYRRFEYEAERARGLDFVEDLFNPCTLSFDLRTTRHATVVASTEPATTLPFEEVRGAEANRRHAITTAAPKPDEVTRTLVIAADQFIVKRGAGQTVIAGYHWFSDWGRDTMIALPGVTLVTRRAEIARNILAEFARHLDRGMIPTRFPDAGEPPEYTSADTTLWFVYAVQMFVKHTRDHAFVRTNLYDVLTDLISWHVRGTRHGIHVDEDGLLAIGPADRPLTWMDVKIGKRLVTPRFGKPVEIQALWYNALRFMETLAKRYDDESHRAEYSALAGRARRAFNRLFWNVDAGCLYDVIDGSTRDASIRPNQVLAVSLPVSMVPRSKAVGVVETVERLLLTPYGLRTLAPTDPRYCGRYTGDQEHRDTAYHQGTVWPWLMGPFVSAYLRVNRTAGARVRVDEWLKPLRGHLAEAGLGQVSEVFDGDPPHRPGGCIAQAWSVAELLKVTVA